MVMFFRRYLMLLLIPSIVFMLSIYLKLASGPYWLATNLDPAYQYIVNGLYIVKGIVPNHIDHPGTPLQILCWAVCCLLNIGQSSAALVKTVLVNPEFYLHGVFGVLALASLITSFLLAVYVYRKTSDRWAALLTQVPSLSFLALKSWPTSDPIIPVVANVSPEPLLISVVNLFCIMLFKTFFDHSLKDRLGTTLWWGLMCGFGVAVKLTFLPLLVIPLIILSWRHKIIFVFVVMGSFVIWTLPIWPKYSQMWGWVTGLLTHTGQHGSGKVGVIELHSYFLQSKNIISQQPLLVVLILTGLLACGWKLVQRQWDRVTFFIAVILGSVLLQFAAVAKHPAPHYLVPGIGLGSALLVFLYLQSSLHHRLRQRIAVVLISFFVAYGTWQAVAYGARATSLTNDILAFNKYIHEKYDKAIFLFYYRSSGKDAALYYGDDWSVSPHLQEELSLIYPKSFYYFCRNSILSLKGRAWANDLLAQGVPVLFQGNGDYDFARSPYEVTFLEKGRYESIHLLTGTTEKQATMSLMLAIQFIQAGDYGKALSFAYQARAFKYQPDSSVENIIQLCQLRQGSQTP